MTKAELIRKIAKRAGVPDSETKIFFDIFLRKAAESLKPGEAFKIKGFGYFQLRRGMIRKHPYESVENKNIIYADLMVYFPQSSEGDEENLIFNVPIKKDAEFNFIDSYFSLSIGKPMIPLKGVKPDDFFIPPTGNELRKLIETKVDKLFYETEKIDKHIKGNEVLVIDAGDANQNQLEITWEENNELLSGKNPDVEVSSKNDSTDYENVSWDFGENLSKEIEEEALLDIGKDDLSSSVHDENLEWNFGSTDGYETKTNLDSEVNSEIEDSDYPNFDKQNEIEAEQISEELGVSQTQDFEASVKDDLENYERVKSVTSEIPSRKDLGLTKSELDLSWNFGEEELSEPAEDDLDNFEYEPANDFNEDEEIIDPEGFQKVKKTTHNIKLDDELEERLKAIAITDDEEELEEAEEQIEGRSVDEDEVEVEEKNKSELVDKDEEDRTVPAKSITQSIEQRLKERDLRYSRKRSPIVFFIAITTILMVAAALYWFLDKGVIQLGNQNNQNKPQEVLTASSPNVVDRKFDIPVTYPYSKKTNSNIEEDNSITASTFKGFESTEIKTNSIDKNTSSADINGTKEVSSGNKENKVSKMSSPVVENNDVKGKVEKVANFIYEINGEYIVQVSSWPSKSTANSQVKKLKTAGFASFVEPVQISGRGTWYRVRVRGFHSLAEAKNFQRTHK